MRRLARGITGPLSDDQSPEAFNLRIESLINTKGFHLHGTPRITFDAHNHVVYGGQGIYQEQEGIYQGFDTTKAMPSFFHQGTTLYRLIAGKDQPETWAGIEELINIKGFELY